MPHFSQSPFDDTVQLSVVMPSDEFSDEAPIVPEENGRSNNRQQQDGDDGPDESAPSIPRFKAYITVATLLFVNLLNYMDRYTIAGVLVDLKSYYHDLGNSEAGIIQTAFICTYMVCSPIFGYLGDRYTRKYLMAGGIFLWSAFTLASSFVPADYFPIFVLLRAFVGIGEASYSTIAPTIIADLFVKRMRTNALMVFYFAIPVGSGLGFIVGSNVATLMHDWKWSLRVTPAFGVLCVVLILLFCQEPERGQSEGGDVHLSNTDVVTDLKALARNKSFMLSSVGFTCVAFVTGALAFLAPTFMKYSTDVLGNPQSESTIGLIFGGITVAAGFLGVALGASSANWYRKYNPRADPLICAFGLLSCVPFLYFSLIMSRINTPVTWFLIFVGETTLCLNWAVTADILLYVVIPTRRSLAESGQILMSHAFGDAISPYIIGAISDSLANKHEDPTRPFVQFPAMQTAMYLTPFVCVLGGAFYLATALFIEKDKKRAEFITHAGSVAPYDGFIDDEFIVDPPDVLFVAEEESMTQAKLNQEVKVDSLNAQEANDQGGGDARSRNIVV